MWHRVKNSKCLTFSYFLNNLLIFSCYLYEAGVIQIIRDTQSVTKPFLLLKYCFNAFWSKKFCLTVILGFNRYFLVSSLKSSKQIRLKIGDKKGHIRGRRSKKCQKSGTYHLKNPFKIPFHTFSTFFTLLQVIIIKRFNKSK